MSTVAGNGAQVRRSGADVRWIDGTSYSRGERGVKPARAWDLDCKLRMSVHRWHGCEGWYLTAPDLRLDKAPLKSADPDDAKAEAIRLVRARLRELWDSFDAATTPGAGEEPEVKR